MMNQVTKQARSSWKAELVDLMWLKLHKKLNASEAARKAQLEQMLDASIDEAA